MRDAYIVFTREPYPGRTKTRMMSTFTGAQCCAMHEAFLKDIAVMALHTEADVVVCYYSENNRIPKLRKIFGDVPYIPQRGETLEEKMYHAMVDAFEMGYDRFVLTGTDIPELRSETINEAFTQLDQADIVLGPTTDQGYYLIAMKETSFAPFDIADCAGENYMERTLQAVQNAGLSYALVDTYHDMDYPEDLDGYRERMENGAGAHRLSRSHTAAFIREHLPQRKQ